MFASQRFIISLALNLPTSTTTTIFMSPIFLQQFMLIKFLVSLLRDEVAIDHWPLAVVVVIRRRRHQFTSNPTSQQSRNPQSKQSLAGATILGCLAGKLAFRLSQLCYNIC